MKKLFLSLCILLFASALFSQTEGTILRKHEIPLGSGVSGTTADLHRKAELPLAAGVSGTTHRVIYEITVNATGEVVVSIPAAAVYQIGQAVKIKLSTSSNGERTANFEE